MITLFKGEKGVSSGTTPLRYQPLPSVLLLHYSITLVTHLTAQRWAFPSPQSKFPGKRID